MKKHIREALRLSGVKPDAIRQNAGHYRLTVGTTTITASCSPRNPDSAIRKIALDLSRCRRTS